MTDIFTKAQRSALMARVQGRGNASTELRLIVVFRALGITGWRRGATIRTAATITKALRASATFGMVGRPVAGRRGHLERVRKPFRVRPDFVFRKLRLAVFVDGCFWHGCPIHATKPRQNAAFWREKIAANKARDHLVSRTLRINGWRVLRIWEHELTRKYERRLVARLRRAGLLPAAWHYQVDRFNHTFVCFNHTA